MNPGKQLQTGVCLFTVHSAFIPQVPRQGFVHLLLTQALFRGQSVFIIHSGRQPV